MVLKNYGYILEVCKVREEVTCEPCGITTRKILTEHVGYMDKIFKHEKHIRAYYTTHNPHMREINEYGYSDYDPKTMLFYIIRPFTGRESRLIEIFNQHLFCKSCNQALSKIGKCKSGDPCSNLISENSMKCANCTSIIPESFKTIHKGMCVNCATAEYCARKDHEGNHTEK